MAAAVQFSKYSRKSCKKEIRRRNGGPDQDRNAMEVSRCGSRGCRMVPKMPEGSRSSL